VAVWTGTPPTSSPPMSLVPPGELTGQRGLRLADRNGQAELGRRGQPPVRARTTSPSQRSLTGDMRVIFASFPVWFAEMINPYIRRWARKLHGTTCQRCRTTAPAWMTSGMCATGSASSPMSSQRIAVQHDHIRMSTGRKGLELALGAQQLRRHARRRAEFRIHAQVQPPSTRAGPRSCSSRPASPAATRPSTCPRRAGTATQKRHECMQRRVDPGKEREISG
jgi:hypothetical protein